MRYLTLIVLLLCCGCDGCQGERKALEFRSGRIEVDDVLSLSAPPEQAPFEIVVDIDVDGFYEINFDDSMVSGLRAEFRYPGFDPDHISLEAWQIEHGLNFGAWMPLPTRLTASEEGLVYDAELPGRGSLDLAEGPLLKLDIEVTEEEGTRTLRFRTVGDMTTTSVTASVSGNAVVQGDNQVTLQHPGGADAVDHAESIVLKCTGDGPAEVALAVEIQGKEYSMDVSFSVDCALPDSPVADELDAFLECPEGMSIVRAGYFGLDFDALAISGKGGWVVIDPATGAKIFQHNGVFDEIWVMAVGFNPFDVLDPQAMLAGGSGTGRKGWGETQSSFLQEALFFVADTDGVSYADGGGQIVTRHSSDLVFATDTGEQSGFPYERAFGEPQTLISAHTAGSGEPVVAVTDESPGRFYAAAAAQTLAFIGEIGDEPRRVRTLDGLWVASNSVSNDLSYGKVHDDGTATIAPDRVMVGERPIGFDLRRRTDGNIEAVSTDFANNRYWITVFDPVACTVVSNEGFDLGPRFVGPGHAIWWPDGTIYISCFTSGNVAVIR